MVGGAWPGVGSYGTWVMAPADLLTIQIVYILEKFRKFTRKICRKASKCSAFEGDKEWRKRRPIWRGHEQVGCRISGGAAPGQGPPWMHRAKKDWGPPERCVERPLTSTEDMWFNCNWLAL